MILILIKIREIQALYYYLLLIQLKSNQYSHYKDQLYFFLKLNNIVSMDNFMQIINNIETFCNRKALS